MALANLATSADLSTRGVSISATALVAAMLAVASATVREAAGSPILETDSTVVLYGWGDQLLPLPGLPVQSVATVEVDGVATTDFTFVGEALWRSCGWGHSYDPVPIEVTLTHGLPAVPADLVDLVCNLAAAGMAEAASLAAGGSFDPRVVVSSIDDYRVQFAAGADAVASVFDLPPLTRSRLRARFGGGASVVEYR